MESAVQKKNSLSFTYIFLIHISRPRKCKLEEPQWHACQHARENSRSDQLISQLQLWTLIPQSSNRHTTKKLKFSVFRTRCRTEDELRSKSNCTKPRTCYTSLFKWTHGLIERKKALFLWKLKNPPHFFNGYWIHLTRSVPLRLVIYCMSKNCSTLSNFKRLAAVCFTLFCSYLHRNCTNHSKRLPIIWVDFLLRGW